MKRLTILLLIIALLNVSVGALAEQMSPEQAARSVVPENAELLRTGKDDGLVEYIFQTPDGMRYEVDVDGSKVVKVDLEAASKPIFRGLPMDGPFPSMAMTPSQIVNTGLK